MLCIKPMTFGIEGYLLLAKLNGRPRTVHSEQEMFNKKRSWNIRPIVFRNQLNSHLTLGAKKELSKLVKLQNRFMCWEITRKFTLVIIPISRQRESLYFLNYPFLRLIFYNIIIIAGILKYTKYIISLGMILPYTICTWYVTNAYERTIPFNRSANHVSQSCTPSSGPWFTHRRSKKIRICRLINQRPEAFY